MRTICLLCIIGTLLGVRIYGDDHAPSKGGDVAKRLREIDLKAELKIYQLLVDEKTKAEWQLIRVRAALLDPNGQARAEKIAGGLTYEQLANGLEQRKKDLEEHKKAILDRWSSSKDTGSK